jgi:hypothetical protein
MVSDASKKRAEAKKAAAKAKATGKTQTKDKVDSLSKSASELSLASNGSSSNLGTENAGFLSTIQRTVTGNDLVNFNMPAEFSVDLLLFHFLFPFHCVLSF